MTREEAIKILKAHHMWTGEPQEIIDVRKENKALEMAIQALSQEPCDDDLIRRDAVFDGLKGCICEEWVKTLFATMVKQLPPVTQKSGKWIKKEDDTCWWYVCSECEQEPLKNRWNDDDVLSTFCPNCGCRMVEPQERSKE